MFIIPGKLCLAVRYIQEVPAPLHERIYLCEDTMVVLQGVYDMLHSKSIHDVVVHTLPGHTTS